MQGRTQSQRQLIVPAWARRIEVIQGDTELKVYGWETWFQPLEREFFAESKDLLDGFDNGRKLRRDDSREAPHFLFAGAKTLAKSVEFVRAYGPVLASRVENPEQPDLSECVESGEDSTVPDVVAYQKLSVLEIEQRLFSFVFDLVMAVNKLRDWGKLAVQAEKKYTAPLPGGPQVWIPETRSFLENRELASDEDRLKIKEIGTLLVEIQGLIDSYPNDVLWESDDPFTWDNPISSFCSRDHIDKDYSLNNYRWANYLLCHIFNLFPPRLDQVNGIVHEMPKLKPSGIRPILYYMLRLEYLSPRELRLCARPGCGGYFAPDRRDATYCSDSCQNIDKQRRFRERNALKGSRRTIRTLQSS